MGHRSSHKASLLGRGYRDDHLDSPRVRFRRALALCAMTVVAPGSAQYAVGRRWVGVVGLFVWAGLLVAGGVLAWRFRTNRSAVLDLLTDTDVLLAARFGVALVAIGWIALLIDAWRMARPFTLNLVRGGLVMLVNTALVLGVGASAVVASQAIDAPRQVIQEVFTATKTSAPLKGRYNILLVGSDSGNGPHRHPPRLADGGQHRRRHRPHRARCRCRATCRTCRSARTPRCARSTRTATTAAPRA